MTMAVQPEHSATTVPDPVATGAQAPLQILPRAVVQAAQAAVQPPSGLFQEEEINKRIYTRALESV
jgi:hypothetical protein